LSAGLKAASRRFFDGRRGDDRLRLALFGFVTPSQGKHSRHDTGHG
jgi:hypothetical protein